MSDLTDLAAKIDAMNLDELLASVSADDLPEPGGDYDTAGGWADRVGVSRASKTFRRLVAELTKSGLMTEQTGVIRRGQGTQKCRLLHCPSLAAKLG